MTRQEISDAITPLGWRLVLGAARASVPVPSLARGADVAVHAVAAAGPDADDCLRVDVRPDRVVLTVQSRSTGTVTPAAIVVTHRVAAAVLALGHTTRPDATQVIELGIDALDIPAIRPFWRAALGYTDEPGRTGPADPLIDPTGQGPAIWFQQMDAPRPQRNRIHLDISVPHDEAPGRMAAIAAAGGTLRYDAEAPAFWVFADPEGNEACITTWRGRD